MIRLHSNISAYAHIGLDFEVDLYTYIYIMPSFPIVRVSFSMQNNLEVFWLLTQGPRPP